MCISDDEPEEDPEELERVRQEEDSELRTELLELQKSRLFSKRPQNNQGETTSTSTHHTEL